MKHIIKRNEVPQQLRIKAFFLMLIITVFALPVSAQINISSLQIKTTPVKNSKELIHKADFIVYGWIDSAHKEYPTGKKIEQYNIINYVQTIHVKKSWKGSASPLVKIVTTGTDPLPDPASALNKIYPGPLAEGDYVCFLQKVPNTDLYSIVGGWQGVYPLFEGETVSLQQQGFPEFGHLTVQEMEEKIRSISGR